MKQVKSTTQTTVLSDDVKVNEITVQLGAVEQLYSVPGLEEGSLFNLNNIDDGLKDFLLSQNHEEDLVFEQTPSDLTLFAQVLDENEGEVPPSEGNTDPVSPGGETLSTVLGGGGGLSSVSASSFSGRLTGDALPGETTASSTLSNLPGLDDNAGETTIDNLFGIPFNNVDFDLPISERDEIGVANNVSAEVEEIPPVVAEPDTFQLEFGEAFFVSFEYSELFANDTGSGPLSLVSMNFTSGGVTESFTPVDTVSGTGYDFFLNESSVGVFFGIFPPADLSVTYTVTDGITTDTADINFIAPPLIAEPDTIALVNQEEGGGTTASFTFSNLLSNDSGAGFLSLLSFNLDGNEILPPPPMFGSIFSGDDYSGSIIGTSVGLSFDPGLSFDDFSAFYTVTDGLNTTTADINFSPAVVVA